MGTAAYMSPEQATAREVDGRSDIFSLALVLFECWQGANPFRRTNFVDTLHAIVHAIFTMPFQRSTTPPGARNGS